MISNLTWVIPSKLPWDMANLRSESYVSSEGRNTKTPELKQSGHPASGAADSSSLSNNSSTFCRTCKQSFNLKYCSKIWIQALNMLKKNILCAGYNDKQSQAEIIKIPGTSLWIINTSRCIEIQKYMYNCHRLEWIQCKKGIILNINWPIF